MDEEHEKVLKRIEKGLRVSASRDWMALVELGRVGRLTPRVAPNGQIEYLYGGEPVRVGP